jgi:hypothetical protein
MSFGENPDPIDIVANACRFQGANPQLLQSGRVLLYKTIIAGKGDLGTYELSIIFDGNDFTGKKKQEQREVNPSNGVSVNNTLVSVIRVDGNDESGNNISYHKEARFARVTNENQKVERFQDFGRMTGEVCFILTFLFSADGDISKLQSNNELLDSIKNVNQKEQVFSIVKSETNSDSSVYIIDYHPKSYRMAQYWIDPSHGYTCPHIIEYWPNGNKKSEYISSEYFLNKASGIYFPKLHIEKQYDQEGTIIHEVKNDIISESLSFNCPISEDEFTVELEPGNVVLDERVPQKNIRYVVDENSKLMFKNGKLDLVAVKGLAPFQEKENIALRQVNRSRISLIIAINLVIIFFILLKIRKKLRLFTTSR